MTKIAFLNEGGFLPVSSGGAYFKYCFFKQLAQRTDFKLFQVSRDVMTDSEAYSRFPADITLISPSEFYSDIPRLADRVHDRDLLLFNDAVSMNRQGTFLKEAVPHVRIGYEAHSVYYQLFTDLDGPAALIASEITIERRALEIADLIFARSKEDAKELLRLAPAHDAKVHVARSGVDPNAIKSLYDPHSTKVLFLGNLNYEPNRRAVEIILKKIAPQLGKIFPAAKLCIAGGGWTGAVPRQSNVDMPGYVEDLDELMQSVKLALCPLLEGSGTRLKILDYLCRGIPVISTRKGIEGLEKEVESGVVIEDDLTRYPALIAELMSESSQERMAELSRNGLRYIKKHRTWDKIISDYLQPIEELWASPAP